MRKHLIWTLALGATLAIAVAGVASAAKITVRVGNLSLTYEGTVKPRALPRSRLAPINLDIRGTIAAIDGTHPPALRNITVDTDKNGAINAKGMPVCTSGRLQAQSHDNAKRACSRAIIGSGTTTVRVAFPDSIPFNATGPLVFFNGGVKGGTTTFFVHAYVAVPTPTPIVTTVKVTRRVSGPYGLRSLATVPEIAGGFGSVLSYKFRIGRNFTFGGRKQSYLLAKCKTGRFYAKGDTKFVDGPNVVGSVVVPCTQKG